MNGTPRRDQQIFELVLAQQRRRGGFEVFHDHAMTVVNREPIRAVRVNRRQAPAHHFGTGHEEVEHDPRTASAVPGFCARTCTVQQARVCRYRTNPVTFRRSRNSSEKRNELIEWRA
jgi:hypothetical protein